jgi:carbonic anhydrase
MATPVQQNLVEKNAQYAAAFDQGSLALPPAKKYVVGSVPAQLATCTRSPRPVTCMDARIDPAAAFGIALGDAHVVRNAGGIAADSLRSIIISTQLLGTKEVLVVKHTGCGMVTFKNEDAHAVVAKNLGPEAAEEIKGLDFLPFPDLDEAVREDVKFLKGSKAVAPDVVVTGWVYEVETGKVRRVD